MKLESLKDIRKMRRITLQEVSKSTGLNPDRISLIERGKVNPSHESVESILKALGCETMIVMDGSVVVK